MAKRSPEPFLWLSFSAGGTVAALVMPVLVFLLGVAFPLEWIDPPARGDLLDFVQNPLVMLALLVVSVLSLAHAAHRFRFTLYDGLQIQHLNEMVALACYGGALVGTVATLYVLWQIP